MSAILKLTHRIDTLSRRVGYIAIYLVLFASLISAFNALARYSTGSFYWLDAQLGISLFSRVVNFYGANSNALLEAQWYMFAGIVMLGGPWTLKLNEHVRVDLVYGGMVSERTRTWIDLLGGIVFLLPMCLLMIYFTLPWFWQSYVANEQSVSAGGLVRWPVKIMVPLGFTLMALQSVSEIIKCVLALRTDYVREFAYEKPLQ